MKLLILTPQLPYPPHQGTTLRNFNIIRNLSPRHEISLASFATPEELENAAPLRTLCRKIEIAPHPSRSLAQRALTTVTQPLPDMALRLSSKEMHRKVAGLFHDTFDVVQIEGIEMTRYAFPRTAAMRQPAILFDDHNCEYALQRTAFQSDLKIPSRWHAALYSFVQWKKLERYERTCCQQANHVVACSDTDADAIRMLLPRSTGRISVIPNGVDTEYYVPSEEVCAKPLSEFAMVFTGKMDFRPNVDAMTWFATEILPRVRSEIPLAHIVIVGQKPTPRIQALASLPGVEVIGWVADTRPYISDAAVYVVPLRMGSGTRLKVLEAMAMGKAIVSTKRGVEGIALTPDQGAVITDNPSTFAQAIVALLHNAERRSALGRSARALAVRDYDWRNLVPRFDATYQSMMNQCAS